MERNLNLWKSENSINLPIADFIGKTTPYRNDSLMNGYLGYILYQFESERHSQYHSHELLWKFVSDIPTSSLIGYSLGSGMTGFTLLLTYLHQNGHIQLDLDEELSELDLQLCTQYTKDKPGCKSGFLDGSLGGLHYLSYRDFSPETNKRLDSVLNHAISTYGTCNTENGKGAWLENNRILLGLLLLNLYDRHLRFKWLRDKIIALAESVLSSMKCICSCQQRLIAALFLYRVHAQFNSPHYLHAAETLGIQSFYGLNEQAQDITNPYIYNGTSGIVCLYKSLYKLTGEFIYITGHKFWLGQTEIRVKEVLKYKRMKFHAGHGGILHGIIGPLLLLNSQKTQNDNWLSLFLLNTA